MPIDAARVREVVRDAVLGEVRSFSPDATVRLAERIAYRVQQALASVPVLSAKDLETLRGMRESRYLSADEASLLDRLLGALP